MNIELYFGMDQIRCHPKVFKLIKCLGRGRTGEVFQARDLLFDPEGSRDISVKLLHSKKLDPEFRIFFSQMIGFKHDSIAEFYGFERVNRSLAMKFEHIPGRSLSDLVKRGEVISDVFLIEWFRQCLSGIFSLHFEGLVHGDVSLSNIIICPKRGAVLIDLEPRVEYQSCYLSSDNELDKKDLSYDLECLKHCFLELVKREVVGSSELSNELMLLMERLEGQDIDALLEETARLQGICYEDDIVNNPKEDPWVEFETKQLQRSNENSLLNLLVGLFVFLVGLVLPRMTNYF